MASKRPEGKQDEARPVCVALNNTLVATDTVWESVFQLIKLRPLSLLVLPIWFFRGKAWFRDRLAQSVEPDPAGLPYRNQVLEYLRSQRQQARDVFLVTSAHRHLARRVADHLKLFRDVLASDEKCNLSGKDKLEAIQVHVGEAGFEYIGQGKTDLPVIEAASGVVLVFPTKRTVRRVEQFATVQAILGNHRNLVTTVIRAMRPHHWTKNLLLAVPLVVAQEWHDMRAIGIVLFAALCFCLVASSGYLWNDIFDLAADRRHPVKRNRPLAAGDLGIVTAVWLAFALAAVALVCAFVFWDNHFWLLLLTYMLTSFAYSIYLKHCMVVDVVVLAGLYTIRILAGGASVDIPVSAWLLAFSMFFFLSLAFAKRYTELSMTDENALSTGRSRPYFVSDLEMFRSAGPACGLLSVLVLALYINSKAVRVLYSWPPALWLLCPLFLYWILRVWFLTMRAATDFDPVVLALRDRISYLLGAASAIILLVARFHS